MEEELRERIVYLRATLNKQDLDVDKLVAILKRDQLLPPERVAVIEKSANKLDRLVDEIVSANDSTYNQLLNAVEQCVPQGRSPVPTRSPVFVTPPPYSHRPAPSYNKESCSTSLTSDSDDDVIRSRVSSLTDAHLKELPLGYGKVTNILNTRPYDHSASSSFLALNDRYSPLPHGDDRHSPLEIIRKQIGSDNRLDWFHIKMQFDGALGELETLKQQNAEKMSQLSKEVEYFRNMYKRSESMGQEAQKELHKVQTHNVKLMADRQQLQEDLAQLEKLREEDKHEMDELRGQHHKAMSALSGPATGTSEVMTDLYHDTLQKYDSLRKDYVDMREHDADLRARHSSACSQLEAMDDLRKQLDEMRRERDAAVRDKMAFQQQCTTVIQNLEQKFHENRRLKADLDVVRHKHEDCSKDQRQAQAKQVQLQKDCGQAMADRDAVMQEYKQVMSERDTVHKEIEQLQEKLAEMSKLTDQSLKEKAAAQKEAECLKQDLAGAHLACDKYRQESQVSLESRAQLQGDQLELQRELQLMEQQRDIARKERLQALEQMDVLIKETYQKTQKEKAEEIDQVAKETEALKKQIDKIKHELTDAEQEAMVATKRRDWAFSEIDKTVQERESIRTLCDNLRRDRDRAVSELAKALRNSDECEKQKNDAVKELKEIRDKYEAMVERDARRQQLNSVGHNHSRDSAIDADLQEWETETLEIELDGGDGHDMGFEVVGGADNPQFPGDSALLVSRVSKGGAAEGKLRVNDLLLKINNLDTSNTERRRAEQALRKHSRALTLVIRRRKSSAARIWQPLQLLVSCQKEGCIQIEQGLFISGLHSERILCKDGMLPSFGDRIKSINNKPADNLTAHEATKMLEKSSQPIVVDVWRQASPLSSTGSSPTPTTLSVLTPLAESSPHSQSAAMSKSDTLPTHSSMWDSRSGDSSRSGGGSSKNLRSSGSQTDSLDSPGPSPPKSLRNHDHDKVRHSMPVLDKAKEIVDRFRFRPKSQDRDRDRDRDFDSDRRNSRDDVRQQKSRDKDLGRSDHDHGGVVVVEDPIHPGKMSSVTQTPGGGGVGGGGGGGGEEFSPSAFTRSPDTGSKSRKRECEVDSHSNNGTWPKSRSGMMITSSLPVPSTVTLVPSKERPSIIDPCFFQPPSQSQSQQQSQAQQQQQQQQQHRNSVVVGDNNQRDGGGGGGFLVDRNGGGGGGVYHHSQQNSDSSNGKYLSGGDAGGPQPSVSSPKAPHFLVGVRDVDRPGGFPTKSRAGPGPGPGGASSSSSSNHHPSPQYPSPQYPRVSPQPAPLRPYPHKQHHYPQGPHPIHPHPIHPNPIHPHPIHPHPIHAMPPYKPLTSDCSRAPVRPRPVPHRVHESEKAWPPATARPPHPYSPGRPVSWDMPYPVPFSEHESRVMSPRNRYPSSPGNQHSSLHMSINPHSPPFSPVSPELEMFPHMLPPHPSGRHGSPSPSQQSFTGMDRITPTLSEEFGPPRNIPSPPHGLHGRLPPDINGYSKHEKRLERIRIPPPTKFGSVEIVSDRSSPVSSIISCGKQMSRSSSRDEYLYSPRHHETRTIRFEKSLEPVGFQIQGGPAGGIFVSSVNDNSLASQAGLVIGDQLLEVCGINMRNATHEHAATVLRQCGDNLSMKVQYNPEKYMDGTDSSSTISVISSAATSPTHSKISSGDSEQSTPKHHTPQRSKSNSSADQTYERPHVVQFKGHKGECEPGFSIVGGNAVGIFVHEIQPDTSAASALQRGHMILEYNNISFHSLTAEQAIMELNKPCSTMRLTVLSAIPKYNKVLNIPGDRFFIRTNFSRTAEGGDELDFRKDDILVVENTVHRGTLGLWLAWLVDEHGNKIRCGSIPSKFRLEDEMVLRRSHSESWSLGDSEELKGSRRGSGSARRSFFRRRRHQRNNSKDSRDLGSFSDASLNSESVPILDDSIMGYTQVERIEYEQTRPVVLLAPLAEPLIRKLMSESPDKYKLCEPCVMRSLMKDMEQSLAEGRFVDYWRKDDNFECVQVNHILNICDDKIHCLLNVNPRAIERLHRLKIYPIVIFVRHKSHKQIKDIRDAQFLPEKLNNKVAKDSFDHFSKLEQEYNHHFSAVIHGGNLAEMSTHIKAAINSEQKKAIWVTVSSL